MSFIKNLGLIQKRLLLVFVVAVFIGGGAGLYKATHKPPNPKEDTIVPSNKASGSSTNNKDKSSNASEKSSSAGVQGDTSGDLVAPSGTLVSNHRPGQNGSNLIEASQCITTPGAKCYIKLTQGNLEKTLPAKTVDDGGSVYWEWDVKNIGLTKGNWAVTAIATLGNQTKSTTDQLPLEVQ